MNEFTTFPAPSPPSESPIHYPIFPHLSSDSPSFIDPHAYLTSHIPTFIRLQFSIHTPTLRHLVNKLTKSQRYRLPFHHANQSYPDTLAPLRSDTLYLPCMRTCASCTVLVALYTPRASACAFARGFLEHLREDGTSTLSGVTVCFF